MHLTAASRTALFVATAPLITQAAGVDVRCARLDAEAAAELRARAQLTLRGAAEPPRRVALECSAAGAWLVWEAAEVERLPVDAAAGLVEGTLAALEQRLDRDEGRNAPPEAPLPATQPGESLALARDPEPTFERLPEVVQVERAAPAGGVALGLDGEPRADSVALGPRLQLGAGIGDIAVVATESLRIGATDATYLFDTRLGCAWGAPFAAERLVGVEGFGGVQGLSGVGREITTPGRRTDSTLLLGIGARVAVPRGPLAGHLGIDLLWRAHPLRLDEPYEMELSRWQVGVWVGVAYRAVPGDLG